jgi:hypothetical protein
MGLRSPQPVNPDQGLVQKLAEMEQRLNQLEGYTGAPIAAPYSASWQTYSGAVQILKYSKDSFGRVRIDGLVSPTVEVESNAASSIVTTLPTGYAPARQVFSTGFFSVSPFICHFLMQTSGVLQLTSMGSIAKCPAGSYFDVHMSYFANAE